MKDSGQVRDYRCRKIVSTSSLECWVLHMSILLASENLGCVSDGRPESMAKPTQQLKDRGWLCGRFVISSGPEFEDIDEKLQEKLWNLWATYPALKP